MRGFMYFREVGDLRKLWRRSAAAAPNFMAPPAAVLPLPSFTSARRTAFLRGATAPLTPANYRSDVALSENNHSLVRENMDVAVNNRAILTKTPPNE